MPARPPPPRTSVLLLAGLLSSCTAPGPVTSESARPIIGGQPSGEADYPATGVMLARVVGADYGQMVCTGTLIAPDVVLTAAHCTIDFFGGAIPLEHFFSFTLDVSTFGQGNVDLPPRTTKVRRMVAHPDFDLEALGGPNGQVRGLADLKDIGLLFLEQPVTDVAPAVLSRTEDEGGVIVGAGVEIAGYGTRQQGGQEAGVKYQANTIINEVGAAEMQIGNLPPTPQKCHGDSGGPTYLAVNDGLSPSLRIIGVTSRAYDESDCNKGGVDSRIEAYRDWLVAEMIAACTDGTRTACDDGGGPAQPGVPGVDSGVQPDAAPPPDTGVPADTGVTDSGAIMPIDAGFVDDAGAATPDASAIVAADAGSGGSIREVEGEGCGCSAGAGRAPAARSIVLLVAAGLVLRRRRR